MVSQAAFGLIVRLQRGQCNSSDTTRSGSVLRKHFASPPSASPDQSCTPDATGLRPRRPHLPSGVGFGGVERKIFGTVDRVAVSARACLNHDAAGPLPLAWVGVAYGASGLDHALDLGRRAFLLGKSADKRAVAPRRSRWSAASHAFPARVTRCSDLRQSCSCGLWSCAVSRAGSSLGPMPDASSGRTRAFLERKRTCLAPPAGMISLASVSYYCAVAGSSPNTIRPCRTYTQIAKIASDHHGCVPPIDSSDSSAPMVAAKIPITRP